MTFEKGAKTIQLRKIVFSSNGAETTGYPHVKKMNLDKDLTLWQKLKMNHRPMCKMENYKIPGR